MHGPLLEGPGRCRGRAPREVEGGQERMGVFTRADASPPSSSPVATKTEGCPRLCMHNNVGHRPEVPFWA